MQSYIAIFLGAGFGAMARYGLQRLFIQLAFGTHYSTLAANLIGCFLIGYLFQPLQSFSESLRLGIITGFLGALTTFSTFALDLNQLSSQDRLGTTILVLMLSVVGGIGFCWLGLQIGKTI